MVIRQGAVCWVELDASGASEAAFRRPVVVIQGNPLNATRIATVVCVALTSKLRWAGAPGNVRLSKELTGLPKESVANVSQLMTIDRSWLESPVAHLPEAVVREILAGIDIILDR